MKNIIIVFTGGTFSMKIDENTGGAIPHFHGDELLDMIPEAGAWANILMYEFGMYPGPHMTPELMLKLSKKVKEYTNSDNIDGIVEERTFNVDVRQESNWFWLGFGLAFIVVFMGVVWYLKR